MGVLDNDTIVLLKGVPKILFTATAGVIPGLFAGKVNANSITDAGDTVKMTMQVKYTSGGAFVEAEFKEFVQADKIIRMTPVEENFGYQITLELLNSSVSASVSLEYVVTRSPIS